MKEISFDEVKSYWEKCTTPTMVYIHSPFCESQCSYCVYRGRPGVPKVIEDQYFQEYLPNQIRKYYPVLDKLDIHSMYFGGGTPNHRGDIEHLRPTVEALKPYIDRGLTEMTIELHMGYEVTERQIKTLKEWGFTTVILCTQAFDTDVLKKKHRLCNFKKDEYWRHVDEVSGLCKKYGLFTGMDLLEFSNSSELESDLGTVQNSFKFPPDEITIAPLYQSRTEESYVNVYRKIAETLNSSYIPDLDIENNKSVKVIRFFKNPDSGRYLFKEFLEDETAFVWNVSCLGIGSYNNIDKWTYSNINQSYTITEHCTDIEEEPKYFLNRSISFWDKCRNIIDAFEEQCNYNDPPWGFSISMKNNPERHRFTDSQDESIFFGYDNCGGNITLAENLFRWLKKMKDSDVRKLECKERA